MSGGGDRLEFRGQYFREKHGAVIPRRYRWRAGFPAFAFMIPQLPIFGERKARSWRSRGEPEAGQRRFCRFVTLQCINERTFIKAETVFSAGALIVGSRVRARARPYTRVPFDIVDFPVVNGEELFFREVRRTRSFESPSIPDPRCSTSTDNRLFQYFIALIKKLLY